MIGKKITRMLCMGTILATSLVNVYAQEIEKNLYVKNIECDFFKSYNTLNCKMKLN